MMQKWTVKCTHAAPRATAILDRFPPLHHSLSHHLSTIPNRLPMTTTTTAATPVMLTMVLMMIKWFVVTVADAITVTTTTNTTTTPVAMLIDVTVRAVMATVITLIIISITIITSTPSTAPRRRTPRWTFRWTWWRSAPCWSVCGTRAWRCWRRPTTAGPLRSAPSAVRCSGCWSVPAAPLPPASTAWAATTAAALSWAPSPLSASGATATSWCTARRWTPASAQSRRRCTVGCCCSPPRSRSERNPVRSATPFSRCRRRRSGRWSRPTIACSTAPNSCWARWAWGGVVNTRSRSSSSRRQIWRENWLPLAEKLLQLLLERHQLLQVALLHPPLLSTIRSFSSECYCSTFHFPYFAYFCVHHLINYAFSIWFLSSPPFRVECDRCNFFWCFKCHSPWHEGKFGSLCVFWVPLINCMCLVGSVG